MRSVPQRLDALERATAEQWALIRLLLREAHSDDMRQKVEALIRHRLLKGGEPYDQSHAQQVQDTATGWYEERVLRREPEPSDPLAPLPTWD